jgi:thiol:disulfide interchange protein DsbD
MLRFLLLGFIFACPVIKPLEAQLSLKDTFPDVPEVVVQGRNITVDRQTGLTTFRVDVHIPTDHHGYLDKGDEGIFIPLTFAFDSLQEHGFQVTEVSRPTGTRDDLVHATVLRGSGGFEFRLETSDNLEPPVDTFSARLHHQICNDVTNICYPPKAVIFPLRFAEGTLAKAAEASAPDLTLSERLTALFRRHFANFPTAFLLVFLAGLVASATPCVYPVIPITSAILMARGRGSSRLGQLNALVYFLGIIFFFTLLGIFAATTGTALSAFMTSAWVNLAFAGIFAYFGLSMIGLYEFQFLAPLIAKLDNTTNRWDGFFGTFLMGTTAGLVISPCVGPIAGAILLSITGQAAGTQGSISSTETAFRGIGLMAGFGMGLGIPFLVVGMLSNKLPQSGPWLTKVKFLLGIPILYFAYVYYLKGTETAAVPPNIAHAILVGIVAIALAVFLGLFPSSGNASAQGQLARRVLAILLLIVGVHFLYNGLGQSGILIPVSGTGQQVANLGRLGQPVGGSDRDSTPTSQVEVSGNLRWLRDFAQAQERAKTKGRPLFVDFYATWCANCKAFQRLAENNDQLNNALQQAVLVKIYDTDEIFETFQRDENYPELGGVGGQPFLPLFAIYSDQGVLHWKGQDYRAVTTMVNQIDEAAKRIVAP